MVIKRKIASTVVTLMEKSRNRKTIFNPQQRMKVAVLYLSLVGFTVNALFTRKSKKQCLIVKLELFRFSYLTLTWSQIENFDLSKIIPKMTPQGVILHEESIARIPEE
jgi:uncharacterized membrane protein